MWQESDIVAHMASNNKYENSGVNELVLVLSYQ